MTVKPNLIDVCRLRGMARMIQTCEEMRLKGIQEEHINEWLKELDVEEFAQQIDYLKDLWIGFSKREWETYIKGMSIGVSLMLYEEEQDGTWWN
jgi:hypothetical protein